MRRAASKHPEHSSRARHYSSVYQGGTQMKSYFRLARSLLALALFSGSVLAQAPLNPDVGDVDSFGHSVIYLGAAQTITVQVLDPCAPQDPTRIRCTNLLPDGAETPFKEDDLTVMHLPARATKTLICASFTPQLNLQYTNVPTAPRFGSFSMAADVTIENSLLNDPALINPVTGQPFGGKIVVSQSNYHEQRGLGTTYETLETAVSSMCSGLISRRNLIQRYGLSSAQATAFFQRPITLRFGASGRIVTGVVTFTYVERLFGDN